jgi:hypothetical protein
VLIWSGSRFGGEFGCPLVRLGQSVQRGPVNSRLDGGHPILRCPILNDLTRWKLQVLRLLFLVSRIFLKGPFDPIGLLGIEGFLCEPVGCCLFLLSPDHLGSECFGVLHSGIELP